MSDPICDDLDLALSSSGMRWKELCMEMAHAVAMERMAKLQIEVDSVSAEIRQHLVARLCRILTRKGSE